MKKVMEKSWNMKSWQKVKECYDQSWNVTNLINSSAEGYQICSFLPTFSIVLESQHFPTFSAKFCEFNIWSCKIEKQSWKSHGNYLCKVYGNPALKMYEMSCGVVYKLSAKKSSHTP